MRPRREWLKARATARMMLKAAKKGSACIGVILRVAKAY